jgi:nitrate/TMAO reductase-like tetraheme cytochrome c subunit
MGDDRTSALAQTPSLVACDKCHADHEFVAGRDSALFVPAETLVSTAHGELTCSSCHTGFGDGYPHLVTSTVVSCASCHEQAGVDWGASIHANGVRENGEGDTPTCLDCHGSHTVYGRDDPRSPTNAMNVATSCGSCHADPEIIGTYFTAPEDAQALNVVEQYHETVHGTAFSQSGLAVSATCNDCHGAHKVLPADAAESSVGRANLPETCGACHVGIVEVYAESAHGMALRDGSLNDEGHPAPVCIDCHSSHGIVRANEPDWFIDVVEECGDCHERLYETYFDTYHGKVTRLGFGLTAKCSDCHTPHAMRPVSDVASTVFPGNLVETCGRCHPGVGTNFVKYRVHADPSQRHEYPLLFWTETLMKLLLASVFTFFGLHTVLWLTRLTIDGLRSGSPRP